MDVFIEQLVTKASSVKDTALKLLLGFGSVLISIALFILLGMLLGMFAVAVLLSAGCLYGAFYLISNFDVEYEYIVTNGEIDIDKVVAKRKRKRLLSAKVSSFKDFGRYSSSPDTNTTTTFAAGSGLIEEEFYADFTHPKYGEVRLIFSPNERVLAAIKPYLPHTIRETF
ncbi:MAG: hypothetical protein RR540_04590 [Oscillospiraceae bacterium]